MKNIEVEVRGPIADGSEYERALDFLRAKGTYKETKNRVLIDYSTFLPEEGIKERIRDIRLRVTNKVPEIITKVGNWGGKESRKELSVKCPIGSFDTLVETYAVLGYTKGVLCVRNSEVFEYKGIEFAVVEVPGHSYYFEAEKMAHTKDDSEAIHIEIESVCAELGLQLFNQDEFFAYVETLNKEANEVFDFAEYTEGYFANHFGL